MVEALTLLFSFQVRDHCHLKGLYLGPSHQSCNLNSRREKPFLSIFFHNFSGYDSHLILPFLTKSCLPEINSVSVLPKSREKFMTIKINNRITFLDSMSFLSGSLENLFENIKTTSEFTFITQSSLVSESNSRTGERRVREDGKERLKLLLRMGRFFCYFKSFQLVIIIFCLFFNWSCFD